MPKKTSLPQIKNILFGELDYPECEDNEPDIADDSVSLTMAVRLDKNWSTEQFLLNIFYDDLYGIPVQKIVSAIQADTLQIKKNTLMGKYLHFRIENLPCKTLCRYEILYNGEALKIKNLYSHSGDMYEVIIQTPPARRDPQPIKIAVGGDQERHEQFGPLATLLGMDNHQHTKSLFEHVGATGDPLAADIEEQPYHMFLHLGDLFNGEMFFSLKNIFRPDRNFIERRVQTVSAFRHHLKTDFGKPVSNRLAHLGCGFFNLVDDHDTGQNDSVAPVTEEEHQAREAMQKSFHEFVLLPKFLEQNKAGPYFKKRVGQSEFFFLHDRYTQEPEKESASLLGEAQWSWLEEVLAASKATNKILISPLPLVMGKNPNEDYRGHWQEWHRLMQLCREHRISTLLTADSHNYSHTEIHVRARPEEAPWIVHHHLIGTLGGSSQHITDAEMEALRKPERQPLLPQSKDFDASLYAGSVVRAYFSPGDKEALLPVPETDESQWTQKGGWSKNTHAYASMLFKPSTTHLPKPDEEFENHDQKSNAWELKCQLFVCSKKQKAVVHEERLDCRYEILP